MASVEEVTGSGIDISFWGRIKPHFNRRETFFTVLLLGVFGLSFFYPMVFLIYMRFRFSEFPELQYYEGYEFGSFSYILIFTFLSIVAVLLPLLAVGLRRTKNTMFVTSSTYQFFYGDFGLILWLIRLVSLKTILLLTSYDTAYRSMSLFITIFLVLLAGSEILFDTYGGSSLRVGLATLFVRFGSSEPLFQSLREASPESKDENQKTVSVGKLTSVEVRTPPPSSEILPPSTTVVTRTPSTAIDAEREVEPSFFTRAGSKVAVTIGNAIIAVLTGIFLVIRILIVTLGMLLISFYEVGLTFVVLVTSYSFDGSYTVPVFQFKELWLYYGASVSFGGFTIWAWHALLLLGIQVFAVSAIQFSGLLLRKPEGIIAKIGKNLNRVFLFVMLLSSVLQLTVFGDSYALIRLALVFGLIVFNELTSWKTREGRKQWQVITLDRPMTSINKDNHSNANEIMTQS